MITWFTSLPLEIRTALLTAAATLVAILLKDVVVKRWDEHRREKHDALRVYRAYADPISGAASSLFWRLRETLVEEGRGAFLKTSGKDTQFDRYKYESTLYRFAVMIGWLRAYRRELTFFSLKDPEKLKGLRRAIEGFELALSEGAHVEAQRVKSLANLWGLQLPESKEEVSKLGVGVEYVLKPFLHSNSAGIARELEPNARAELCRLVSAELTRRLQLAALDEAVIDETIGRAIESLSIREGWIYRDFQAAIGDLMIEKVQGGARRFEVIGFAKFEEMLLSEIPTQKRWTDRLDRMIDGLDISGADRFDARVQMLEDTFVATMELLIELFKLDPDRGILSKSLLDSAGSLLEDRSWRKSSPEL